VARAYLRPLDGEEGAGEGGRSWPSRSIWERALVVAALRDGGEAMFVGYICDEMTLRMDCTVRMSG